MLKIKYIFILIIMLLLSSGWGPLGCNGLISGKVVDGYGRSVNDATIALYFSKYKIMETTTDNAGLYAFNNVVWGKYELRVNKDGYLESKQEVTLGESYGCSQEVTDITLQYDNETAIQAAYLDFLEAIKGDNEKLDSIISSSFIMTFTGVDEVICNKNNFCQNCPVPGDVTFSYSGIETVNNETTMEVSFIVEDKSEIIHLSKLTFIQGNNSIVPSWKVAAWEVGLIDFKPAAQPGKGWADPDGYIEYDSQLNQYRWVCSW